MLKSTKSLRDGEWILRLLSCSVFNYNGVRREYSHNLLQPEPKKSVFISIFLLKALVSS